LLYEAFYEMIRIFDPALLMKTDESHDGRVGVQGETGLPPPGSRSSHVSHSVLMGTINFPDSGEGQMPDLNRVSSDPRFFLYVSLEIIFGIFFSSHF